MAKRLAAAILAAGSSRRFGNTDKLSAIFHGKLLGLHAACAVPRNVFADRWVITSAPEHACAKDWLGEGWDIRVNPDAEQGMGTSVAMAASLAREAGADALLIALADMPLVPREHFTALAQFARNMGDSAVGVSSNGPARTPPAIFGAAHFDALAKLEGDQGARDLLREGEVIACSPEWLRDIDTPEELARLA